MDDKNPWIKTDKWADEIEILFTLLAKTKLVETKKWGGPVFTFNNKNIIGVGGFNSYFGLWFYNGVFLEDKAGKLIVANDGVTKSLRQWRFSDKQELMDCEKLILNYVDEAIEIEQKGLSLKTQRKETIVDDAFAAFLESDLLLKFAFGEFSPYKQREFIEHISSAKREATKLERFEKIRPLILSKTGLHDKYRK